MRGVTHRGRLALVLLAAATLGPVGFLTPARAQSRDSTIKAAPNRKYGEIIRAMDVAKGAGVQVIGFTPADPATAAAR